MWLDASGTATECESYQLGYNLSNAYVDKLQYLRVHALTGWSDWLTHGQDETKFTALADCALHTNFAAKFFDNPPHN